MLSIFLRTASTAIIFLSLLSCSLRGQDALGSSVLYNKSVVAPHALPSCRIVYLGFVGGLEPSNDKYSGVVQIRQALQSEQDSGVCAKSFSPYAFLEARDWLSQHFPRHPGPLSPEELSKAPKVILVGHSMGGWAMLEVARHLRDHDIPVELTIQVDSVGITDHTVPRNVKCAAIFHANDALFLLITKHVRREDPKYTKLLIDATVSGAGHISVTRDPRIRELVFTTIQNLQSAFAAQTSRDAAASTNTYLGQVEQ